MGRVSPSAPKDVPDSTLNRKLSETHIVSCFQRGEQRFSTATDEIAPPSAHSCEPSAGPTQRAARPKIFGREDGQTSRYHQHRRSGQHDHGNAGKAKSGKGNAGKGKGNTDKGKGHGKS